MKKLIGAVLAAVMAVSLLTVTAGAAANILDTPKTKITSGKTNTFTISETSGENDYKVTLSEDGDLKFNMECNEKSIAIILFDSKGEIVKMTKRSASTGSWDDNSAYSVLNWNSYSKKSNGVIEWKNLKKGTYYVRFGIYMWQSGGFKYTVTATFPDGSASSSTEVKEVTFQFTLKKGETLKPDPQLTPANGTGNIKWKSSKTSVATVSANGTVTAVGKGTATITCTAGKGSAKIIIKVS